MSRGKGLSGAHGRFRCSTKCTGFFSCLPSSLSGSARGSTPPRPTYVSTAASLVCPAHVPILPLASTRCSVQSFEACAPCYAVAGWVGGAKEKGACQYARANSSQRSHDTGIAPRRQKVMRVTGFARERPLIRNDYHVARSLRGSIALSVGCEPRLLCASWKSAVPLRASESIRALSECVGHARSAQDRDAPRPSPHRAVLQHAHVSLASEQH